MRGHCALKIYVHMYLIGWIFWFWSIIIWFRPHPRIFNPVNTIFGRFLGQNIYNSSIWCPPTHSPTQNLKNWFSNWDSHKMVPISIPIFMVFNARINSQKNPEIPGIYFKDGLKLPDWDHIGLVHIPHSPYLLAWIPWLLYSHIGSIVKPSFPRTLISEDLFDRIGRDVWNLEVVCKSLWFPKNWIYREVTGIKHFVCEGNFFTSLEIMRLKHFRIIQCFVRMISEQRRSRNEEGLQNWPIFSTL